jgi:hypothetical protein
MKKKYFNPPIYKCQLGTLHIYYNIKNTVNDLHNIILNAIIKKNTKYYNIDSGQLHKETNYHLKFLRVSNCSQSYTKIFFSHSIVSSLDNASALVNFALLYPLTVNRWLHHLTCLLAMLAQSQRSFVVRSVVMHAM